MKPWDPPEERLYPVLDDLLSDWLVSYHPPFAELRVIGHRWSPRLHEILDFLARNQVPYRWLDIENSKEANQLLEQLGLGNTKEPVVIFPDGSYLVNPNELQIAEKINLKTHAEKPFYDLIIIGSGPAGLAAGVYGASEGLCTLLVEQEAPGGQAGTSSRIENYLGFPAGLSGGELARRAVAQVERFGAEIVTPQSVYPSIPGLATPPGRPRGSPLLYTGLSSPWRGLAPVPGWCEQPFTLSLSWCVWGNPRGRPYGPGLLATIRLLPIHIYIYNMGFVSHMLFYFLGNIRIAQLLDFS
jgi:hypothetical protein